MPILKLPINIDKKSVLRYLGHKDEKKLPSRVEEEVNTSIIEAQQLINAKVCYDYFNFTIDEANRIIFSRDVFFIGDDVVKKLKKADHLVIAILTLGDGIDKKSIELFSQGNYLKGMTYNSIGCAVLDDLRKTFRCKLKEELRPSNRNITKSYSPGNGGWEISNQYTIFKLLDAATIGVSLLQDSMMMKPAKSLSVVHGVCKESCIEHTVHDCSKCNSRNCYYRIS